MTDVPHRVKDRTTYLEAVELDENGNGLTQWEIDFLDSILRQLRAGSLLSPAQREVLGRIRDARLE